MATRNIVPRANGEGSLGTSAKHWGNIYADNVTIAGRNIANDGAILATHETEITNLQSQVTTLEHAYAGAKAAATVADMTDHNQIYVYVGSESGYTNGNWYYWNGTAWTSGGVYNATALETDKTLTVSNAAADAKTTGELIRMLEGSDLHNIITTPPNMDTTNIITAAYGSNNKRVDQSAPRGLVDANGYYTIQCDLRNFLPILAFRYIYITGACEYYFMDTNGTHYLTEVLSISSAGFIEIPKDNVGYIRMSFVGDISNCQQTPAYVYTNHVVPPTIVTPDTLFECSPDLYKININNYNSASAQISVQPNTTAFISTTDYYTVQFTISPEIRERLVTPRIYAKNAGRVIFIKKINGVVSYCAYSYREFSAGATIFIPPDAKFVRFSFPSANGVVRSENDPVYILMKEPVVKKFTVGASGCDYTTIKGALDSIHNTMAHNEAERIEVHATPGTYEISGVNYLGVLNYVDIIGDDPATTIVKHIASTTTYDATKAGFDPAYYTGEKIYNATIKNLTIITEGCKCPVHIDGNNIIQGGKITIENCVLIDQNGAQMNLSNNNDYALRTGGVNCGLGNGQTVVVKNCFSNGVIYAHNHQNSTVPSTFIVDGCVARNTMIGHAFSNDITDTYIVKDSTLDYISTECLSGVTKSQYIVELSNNHVNFVFAPYKHLPYAVFNTLFDGKCGIFEGSCLCFAFNDSNSTIQRGDFLEFVSDANDRGLKAPLFVKKATGNNFAGMAMEDIAAKSIGLVQYRGKFSIPAIVGANNGDFVDFVNGGFVLHASGNTPIGRYGAPSILVSGEYFVCID